MKASLTWIGLYVVLVCLAYGTYGAQSSGASIAEATAHCEDVVPRHCVSTTCPLYCNSFRSNRMRNSCKSGCNTSNRCKLNPIAGVADDPKYRTLDAQNRDQLFACIAQIRDPSGSVTGRRMELWQEIRTPSFKKATRT